MPRPPPIYSDFFDEFVTEDVEELLARFQQMDSVRYEEFSAIWRQMSFSDIFRGITNMAEMKRFSKVMLATAVKYFLLPYSYQIRVGGLYLMSAFYHLQLTVPPVRIRLALKDWAQIQKFVKDTVDSGHLDVIYIYEKLVAAKAIDYTAMPHMLFFQKQKRPKKQTMCADFLGRTTAVQDLVSAEILEELDNIQSQYEKMKADTKEVSCHVTMTHQDFITRLSSCVSEFVGWQQKTFLQENKDDDDDDDDEEEEDQADPSSRARLLSSIKQKSYNTFQEASKARRHRQAVTVDSSSAAAEQLQESQRRRPPSLRARAVQNLGLTQEGKLQTQVHRDPELKKVKGTNQGAK